VEINTQILRRHLAEAAVEQLAEDYRQRGYHVVPSDNGNDGGVDLVVERDGAKIYFQVKSAPGSPEDKELLKKVRRYVSGQPNAQFRLVLVRPPEQPAIEIQDFERRLLELCLDRIDDLAVSEIASGVFPQEVTDVDFELIEVSRDGIEVQGTALASFELEYGGEGDDGLTTHDSYPLSFHLRLNHDLEIDGVEALATDVSSFYE
jgi:hypothetical protein